MLTGRTTRTKKVSHLMLDNNFGKCGPIFISPYSVAFGVILSLLFCLFVCTVEDISTQDGAIGVKFWLRAEQTS